MVPLGVAASSLNFSSPLDKISFGPPLNLGTP